MKTFSKKTLGARLALVLALTAGPGVAPVKAGIPTFDITNLVQNVISALEAVAQTAKQIEQYQTQLQQYENMLQNTAAPVQQIWDQAQATMSGLRSSIDTLSYYKQQLGSVDSYVNKFQDLAYYRNSPCFNSTGCSAAQFAALADGNRLGSEAQKKATDALFRGLDKQQDALQSDASQLERLQSGAQGASGQMQAMGFANQLASQQANQLLQIRALLVAEQNAIATRNQVLADREAQEAAASEQARRGSYAPSPARSWGF